MNINENYYCFVRGKFIRRFIKGFMELEESSRENYKIFYMIFL